MSEEYMDRRRHFRTICDLPARFRLAANPRTYRIRLTDLNETGLSFASSKTQLLFKPGDVLTLTVPLLSRLQMYDFAVKWFKTSRGVVRTGAAVLPGSEKAYSLLVETVRHIQCWREVEQHNRKKPVSMAAAIRDWRRCH